jgi:4-amino-4-deoxy-L-arabinose transferase-like glycosyltransferase
VGAQLFLKTPVPPPKLTVGAKTYWWDRIALASILAGAIIRVVWGLVIHPPLDFLYSDMGSYVERAQRLAAGGPLWRIDAFHPPGTHMLLAAPMKLLGTGSAGLWAGAVLWCLLSSLIPLLTWRFARLLLTLPAAALATVLCAFWPPHITYGAFFTSETPSLALMVAALWAGYRAIREQGKVAFGLGLLAGVLAGAAIGSRPQWILNLMVLAFPLLLRFRRQATVVAGIIIGTTALLGGVLLHNSVVAEKPTGLSENSGVNFWMGHCDVRTVTTNDPRQNIFFTFSLPVAIQLERGGIYSFKGHLAWDQPFFYDMGWQCIQRDGLDHIPILVRNTLDMTATTVPWPQVDGENGQRSVVQASNLVYALLLPWIVIESVFLIRRRHATGRPSGELIMLAHLACVVLVAILYFGDPRLRTPYDVFGLSLLAALITDRFGLDQPDPDGQGSVPDG